MKITYVAITTGVTACLLVAASALQADDKDKNNQATSTSSSTAKGLSKATNLVTAIRQSQPPQSSTSTRTTTASQIANTENAKAKARETGVRIDRINVPSPVRKVDTKNLNPNNDPDVARDWGRKLITSVGRGRRQVWAPARRRIP